MWLGVGPLIGTPHRSTIAMHCFAWHSFQPILDCSEAHSLRLITRRKPTDDAATVDIHAPQYLLNEATLYARLSNIMP